MRSEVGVRRFRSVALAVTSVVMVSTVGSGLLAGPAWAQKKTITCTGFNGLIVLQGDTTGSVWGCSSGTGGSGTYISGPGFSLSATSMTIKWANGTSTTVGFVAHIPNGTKGCSVGFKFKAKGRVSADTNGSTGNGSKVAFAFCELPTAMNEIYTMTMATGAKFKL